MAGNDISTVYIKGTGRRRAGIGSDGARFSRLDGGDPGVVAPKHAVFNWKQELVVANTDGTKQSYDLVYTPIYGATLSVYINGLLQRQGVDYTLDGKTFTFNMIIPAGFNIVAKYNAMAME
jgi:hypothetical protein